MGISIAMALSSSLEIDDWSQLNWTNILGGSLIFFVPLLINSILLAFVDKKLTRKLLSKA